MTLDTMVEALGLIGGAAAFPGDKHVAGVSGNSGTAGGGALPGEDTGNGRGGGTAFDITADLDGDTGLVTGFAAFLNLSSDNDKFKLINFFHSINRTSPRIDSAPTARCWHSTSRFKRLNSSIKSLSLEMNASLCRVASSHRYKDIRELSETGETYSLSSRSTNSDNITLSELSLGSAAARQLDIRSSRICKGRADIRISSAVINIRELSKPIFGKKFKRII